MVGALIAPPRYGAGRRVTHGVLVRTPRAPWLLRDSRIRRRHRAVVLRSIRTRRPMRCCRAPRDLAGCRPREGARRPTSRLGGRCHRGCTPRSRVPRRGACTRCGRPVLEGMPPVVEGCGCGGACVLEADMRGCRGGAREEAGTSWRALPLAIAPRTGVGAPASAGAGHAGQDAGGERTAAVLALCALRRPRPGRRVLRVRWGAVPRLRPLGEPWRRTTPRRSRPRPQPPGAGRRCAAELMRAGVDASSRSSSTNTWGSACARRPALTGRARIHRVRGAG